MNGAVKYGGTFLSSQLSEAKARHCEFKATLGYKSKLSLNKTKQVNRLRREMLGRPSEDPPSRTFYEAGKFRIRQLPVSALI